VPWSAYVEFVADVVALKQVLRYSPISIIPLLFQIHLYVILWIDNRPVTGPVEQKVSPPPPHHQHPVNRVSQPFTSSESLSWQYVISRMPLQKYFGVIVSFPRAVIRGGFRLCEALGKSDLRGPFYISLYNVKPVSHDTCEALGKSLCCLCLKPPLAVI
jgi:hypothetical protein